MHSVVKI